MKKCLWGMLTLLVALCFALTACGATPDGQTEDSDSSAACFSLYTGTAIGFAVLSNCSNYLCTAG